MKRLALFITLLTAVAAAPGWAYLGEVVGSWSPPDYYPYALACNRNNLWVFCHRSPYLIYRMNPTTGSVRSSYGSPFGTETRGLSFTAGGYLWIGDRRTNYVYRCRAADGSIYGSWDAGHDMSGGLTVQCRGDGGYRPYGVFTSEYSARRLYRHNLTTGSINFRFRPHSEPWDLGWDWRNGLVWVGSISEVMYGYTQNGSQIASFRRYIWPTGVCYSGEYLWIATRRGSGPQHRIWKIHCPGTLSIPPASLGRVKALFR